MKINLQPVSWNDSKEDLLRVRYTVFVEEQGVPADIEQDSMDPEAGHVLLTVDGKPVATGRLLPDGYIGRVAVLKEYRGRGFGTRVMNLLTDIAAQKGCRTLKLSSQLHAKDFYLKLGYKIKGDPYIEAGIPHVRMFRDL